MPDVFSAVGWEHGGIFTGITVNGSLTGGGVNGSIVASQYGRRGYQHEYVDSTAIGAGHAYGLQFGTSTVNPAVASIYFAVPALPGRNQVIGMVWGSSLLSSDYFVIRLLPTGYIEAGFGAVPTNAQTGALTGSVMSASTICVQRWHRLDVSVDGTANPWVADWQLNGVAQTQTTKAAASRVWSLFTVGVPGVHSNPATTLYTDDLATSNADYPLGPRESFLLKPNAMGSNNNPGAFGDAFNNESGGTQDANSWQRISDGAPPLQDGVVLASANDGLSMHQPVPGYVTVGTTSVFNGGQFEVAFDTVTLDTGIGQSVACLHGYQETYMSSPQPPRGFKISILTGTENLGTNVQAGNVGGTVRGRPWNNGGAETLEKTNTPTGGWDQSKIDDLRMQWEYDVSGLGGPDSSKYHGLAWFALELHLTSSDEPGDIGCVEALREQWGAIPA